MVTLKTKILLRPLWTIVHHNGFVIFAQWNSKKYLCATWFVTRQLQ
ncbi:Putative protein [Zobellia galactanivorans]|uniref:Uncharacterized protein n=1 Tax=Zobellia galactanivorans (strain DSM 12802 / CCUG 47099 / CIP 106680 / NCIMB 13871 / Dsij) TaxID=63186 RepID=G0KZQ1_ZOBGA|nr:Putative protein [Zobellia galactanivorans]